MLARREVGTAIICWILLNLASVACSEIWVGVPTGTTLEQDWWGLGRGRCHAGGHSQTPGLGQVGRGLGRR